MRYKAKQHCQSTAIYLKIGPNWQCCLAGSSKTAPRILIFSIAMGANYSFYVKSIPTCAPTFFGYYGDYFSLSQSERFVCPKIMYDSIKSVTIHSSTIVECHSFSESDDRGRLGTCFGVLWIKIAFQIKYLKSAHFKKTVAWISFLLKLWYFLIPIETTTILKETRFTELSS